MKKYFLIAALAAGVYFALVPHPGGPARQEHSTTSASAVALEGHASGDAAIENAFVNRLGNQQLGGQGTVVKLLPDDQVGSRHQRFIVRLDSGRTLLVAHNIDLAQRIETLRAGDSVAFYGEYEWNPKGGVIHWTHHDPQGRHPAGWIRHDDRIYQ